MNFQNGANELTSAAITLQQADFATSCQQEIRKQSTAGPAGDG